MAITSSPPASKGAEYVLDWLWPDTDLERGTNNLHKVLYVARRILEPAVPRGGASSYLQLRRGVLVLEAPGGLCIDVDTFLAAAGAARRVDTPQASVPRRSNCTRETSCCWTATKMQGEFDAEPDARLQALYEDIWDGHPYPA